MAAALVSFLTRAPQPDHRDMILSPRSYLTIWDSRKKNLERIIFSWSRYSRSDNLLRHRNIITADVLHDRRFASVSVFPLFALPYSHRHICSRSDRFCRPRSPLLLVRRSRAPRSWACLIMSQSQNEVAKNHQGCTKSVRCLIKGRVQGVFYRNWTVENATQIGLNGWVRNRRDGSVEAVFSGKPDAVDEMQQRCRRGPPDAMVTGMEAFPFTDDPGTGFQRKPTI